MCGIFKPLFHWVKPQHLHADNRKSCQTTNPRTSSHVMLFWEVDTWVFKHVSTRLHILLTLAHNPSFLPRNDLSLHPSRAKVLTARFRHQCRSLCSYMYYLWGKHVSTKSTSICSQHMHNTKQILQSARDNSVRLLGQGICINRTRVTQIW